MTFTTSSRFIVAIGALSIALAVFIMPMAAHAQYYGSYNYSYPNYSYYNNYNSYGYTSCCQAYSYPYSYSYYYPTYSYYYPTYTYYPSYSYYPSYNYGYHGYDRDDYYHRW